MPPRPSVLPSANPIRPSGNIANQYYMTKKKKKTIKKIRGTTPCYYFMRLDLICTATVYAVPLPFRPLSSLPCSPFNGRHHVFSLLPFSPLFAITSTSPNPSRHVETQFTWKTGHLDDGPWCMNCMMIWRFSCVFPLTHFLILVMHASLLYLISAFNQDLTAVNLYIAMSLKKKCDWFGIDVVLNT